MGARVRLAGSRERAHRTKDNKSYRDSSGLTVSKYTTMDNLPPLTPTARFYFRFVDSIGFDSCDTCYQTGPVDHFCLKCCFSEGMTLGSCFVCHNGGPVWEYFHWCKRGHALPPVHGQCHKCKYHGILGKHCNNCDDGTFLPVSTSDDPPVAEADQDTEPVASRTGSSAPRSI
jgi:hypothetical protein